MSSVKTVQFVEHLPPSPGSHFCAAVIWRLCEDPSRGEYEFLVISYSEEGRPGTETIKFPGGTNNTDLKEKQVGTMRREFLQEVLKPGTPRIEGLNGASAIAVVDKGPNHRQFFFLIGPGNLDREFWKKNSIRREQLREPPDKPGRPFELLGEPTWMSETELRDKIFRSHAPVLEAAVEFITSKRRPQ